jgi:hypothetical protein
MAQAAFFRLAIRQIFKDGIGYLSKTYDDKKTAEKKKRLIFEYARNVSNEQERAALALFMAFPTKETWEYAEEFKKILENGKEKKETEKKFRLWVDNLATAQRLPLTPERLQSIEKAKGNVLVFGYLLKLYIDSEFREKMFEHYRELNNRMNSS